MNETDFAELAAGHSLGALSEADERRYQDALTAHPEWRWIAEDDDQTTALLAEGAPVIAPPAAVRDALLARIAQTPQISGVSDSADEDAPEPAADSPADASRPRPRRRLVFALAACLVLIVGLGIGASVVITQALRPAAVVALEQIENAPDAAQKSVSLADGGTATAHWSASVGDAVLVTDGLPPLDRDQTYELWFVRDGSPVSAGVFSANRGKTTAQLQGTMQAGDAIAVTVEQAGGSPTGAPTTDPLVVIPTS